MIGLSLGLSLGRANGGGVPSVPSNAIRDRASNAITDRAGGYILERA